MSEGVLYVARGERYVDAAAASARSVRAAMPDVAVAIATDGPAPADFDEAVPLTEPDGYRAKIVGMLGSPFERTLYLDADTYATADLSELFALLDAFDLAAAQAPNRVALPLEDVPDSFPELNTGVIAFRRSESVERFLSAWLSEYDRLLPQDPTSKDQPSFRRALYTARDVRPAVLPTEFNVRFWKAGYYNQPVRILHGWGDAALYQEVATVLNTPATTRRYRAVFIGYALIDKSGTVVARFPEKPERIRRKARQAPG